jgi:hypothetical protein
MSNTKINSCLLPENRGVSQSNRAGWSSGTGSNKDGKELPCHNHPSDHYEEEMHQL